jgi:uncharacterized protein
MAKTPTDKDGKDPTLDRSDLSRAYRAGVQEQPPPRLDAAIVAEARKAVESHPASRSYSPFGSSWTVPLSAAAVVVLSVVLVIFMERETPLQEQVLLDAPTTDVYVGEKKAQVPPRTEEMARAPTPPAAPPIKAPAASDELRAKREAPADMTAASPATGAASAARERHNKAAEAQTNAAPEEAGKRSSRLFAKSQSARVVDLKVGNRTILAELASTSAEVERGLMHREQLPPDSGMLFLFPSRPSGVCMWMKNTRIPLSAAFLDRNGTVLKIADMQPLDETVHCADGEVRFVLELNRGAFVAAGVKPGMRIGGLPPLQD